jgi:hypothetical protein
LGVVSLEQTKNMHLKIILPNYMTTWLEIPCHLSLKRLQETLKPHIHVPTVQYSYLDLYEEEWLDILDEDDWEMAP